MTPRLGYCNVDSVSLQVMRAHDFYLLFDVFCPGRGHLALAQTRRRHSPRWSAAHLEGGHRNPLPGLLACDELEEGIARVEVTCVGG